MPEQLPPNLMKDAARIADIARSYGLDFYDTIFQILDYDELNMVAAYGGFPTRYPHWRFGMEYEALSKSYQFGLSKIYEMVINTNPSYAYLMKGNTDTDQRLVMAHVYGHVDFFKHNVYFAHTNRKMVDEMANHATRVRRTVDKIGIERVENFIDSCLSIENLIDRHSTGIKRRRDRRGDFETPDDSVLVPAKMKAKSYMDKFINPKEFLEAQQKKIDDDRKKARRFPEEPVRDVMLFLLENAPLEAWEQDILEIIHDEAYYFAPQGMTKIANEGWACVRSETPVFTERGLLTMAQLVDGQATTVHDGQSRQRVYDRNIIKDHDVIDVVTRRGLKLGGSDNHRVLLADGETWKRLDELVPGDEISISGGGGMWATEPVKLSWTPDIRVGLQDVADAAGVSLWTVLRHRDGKRTRRASAIAGALAVYEEEGNQALPQAMKKRVAVRIPEVVDETLGTFLGYLVGDGHISRVKRELGLTTGDVPQAETFVAAAQKLFDVRPIIRTEENKLRVHIHSETVSDFLVDGLGLTHGPSARQKRIPDAVLRSPEPVVRAFLRAYFDCDGYAGKQGVILSTSSDALAEQVQLLLLNYGILTRKRKQKDECWHVQALGASARRFRDLVGFGLERKQRALSEYCDSHHWEKRESWTDEVVATAKSKADVYDISVEETHRYAAGGFINHNSFWHSTLMTRHILTPNEFIDYADHHSGTLASSPGRLNPYKLGIELLRDIEDRWNKGKFGKDYDECRDMVELKNWDKKLGLGREKIFEVRRLHNDVTFIDEFLTPEFAINQKLFTYDYNKNTNSYEIRDREFNKVKQRLLFMLTNHGQPFIRVIDGNFENRGELLLQHQHEGIDLDPDYSKDTLRNLHTIWRRPVNIETAGEGKRLLLSFDGKEYKEKELSQMQLL